MNNMNQEQFQEMNKHFNEQLTIQMAAFREQHRVQLEQVQQTISQQALALQILQTQQPALEPPNDVPRVRSSFRCDFKNLNIPQFVSKDREPGDWMLNKEISAELFAQWSHPKIDLFASKRNKQAEFFYRNSLDKSKLTTGCLGNDANAAKWHREKLLYANPPWDLTEKPIAKLKKERDYKFSKLLQTIAPPVRLQHTKNLFIPPSQQGKNEVGVGLPHWKPTYAYLVSGIPKPDSIPISTKSDSRFIFNGTIGQKPANILVDSGCTTMVLSADFVKRFKIPTVPIKGISLKFGNGSDASSHQQVILELV